MHVENQGERNEALAVFAEAGGSPRSPRVLAQALLVGVGVCAAVFVPYEIVERLFLQHLSREDIELAHFARGVGASILAALATSTVLFGRAVPSLERSLEQAPRKSEADEELRTRLAVWLVELRWVAAVAAGAVIAVATLVTNRVEARAVPYLWVGLGALVGWNAVLAWIGPRRLSAQRALTGQVLVDVAVLAFLLHHAGGVLNPFAGFFVFHAVIAAVVLEPGPARRMAAAIAGFVAVLTALETTGAVPAACILDARGACATGADGSARAASGFGVAVLVLGSSLIAGALVRALRGERARLAHATEALSERTREITAAEAQIRRERENLQTIIDCMADAVIFAAPGGDVVLRNRAAMKLWPDHESTPAGDLRTCHTPDAWQKLVHKVANPGPIEQHPVLAVRDRSYEASYAPVRDRDGSLHGVVMVARDVTERIEAQKWRMEEERMAVVGKMAAGLAHELNNPLGAIALFTQHALEGMSPDHPLSEHLGTVLRNANLCTRILRDLLEYARRRPPERRKAAMRDVLGDVTRTLEPHAAAVGVALRTEADAGPEGGLVWGDSEQLRQVLVNLGLNAIEAMPDGGTLTFRLVAEDSGCTRVDVVDTGTGIPQEELERVFSAFHTTKPEGTGLGLTVANDIVAAHGGCLEASSEPGKGSTFTVRLPPLDAMAAASPAEDAAA